MDMRPTAGIRVRTRLSSERAVLQMIEQAREFLKEAEKFLG
jgi:hypothetical protein